MQVIFVLSAKRHFNGWAGLSLDCLLAVQSSMQYQATIASPAKRNLNDDLMVEQQGTGSMERGFR